MNANSQHQFRVRAGSDDRDAVSVAGRAPPLYARHFGLNAKPFSLLPDPDFLHWSPVHRRAYAMLEYGLQSFAPIIVITGEIGAGKTTLLRHLLRTGPADLTLGLISDLVSPDDSMLTWALSALGCHTPPKERAQLAAMFEGLLRDESRRGRRVALVIDEAQKLSRPQLEELRCLTNLNTELAELVQVILVGQPELNRAIASQTMRQFAQRVGSRFHLGALSASATADYIAHRLKVAGAAGSVFAPGASALVYSNSAGLPRLINQLCDYGLVYAFAESCPRVERRHIELVLRDRRIQAQPKTGRTRQRNDRSKEVAL